MKWVKVAIGAVIAILSIGIIATSVYDMTQERVVLGERTDKLVGEITSVNESTYAGRMFFTPANFNAELQTSSTPTEKIENGLIHLEYNGQNGDFVVKITGIRVGTSGRIATVIYNDVEYFEHITFGHTDSGDGYFVRFETDFNDTFGFEYEIGDTLTLYEQDNYTIPPQLTGISATLILLTPLIFAGGVLAYLLNKQNY